MTTDNSQGGGEGNNNFKLQGGSDEVVQDVEQPVDSNTEEANDSTPVVGDNNDNKVDEESNDAPDSSVVRPEQDKDEDIEVGYQTGETQAEPANEEKIEETFEEATTELGLDAVSGQQEWWLLLHHHPRETKETMHKHRRLVPCHVDPSSS